MLTTGLEYLSRTDSNLTSAIEKGQTIPLR